MINAKQYQKPANEPTTARKPRDLRFGTLPATHWASVLWLSRLPKIRQKRQLLLLYAMILVPVISDAGDTCQ